MNLPPPNPTQARIIWWALTSLAVAALVAVGVGLLWGVGQVFALLAPVLWPLAVAGVLAYLLDPLVDSLERRGLARPKAIVVVFALAILVMLGLAASVLPQLYKETKQLAERIPAYAQATQQRLDDWMANPPAVVQKFLELRSPASSPTNVTHTVPGTNAVVAPGDTNAPPAVVEFVNRAIDRATLKSATNWLGGTLPKIGRWMLGKVSQVASWFGILAGIALVPVYAFYFLIEKSGIESQWTDYLPLRNSKLKDEIVFVLRSINNYLIVFFRSQLLVALCDGALYTVGFLVIGLPYSLLLGVMATFLTMIPFLGAITTCAAALVIALVQYGDWLHPALVLAVFGVVQALEGLVISPKIMGDRVGLHPLTIIVSVMVGTTLLGGILGGVLAIPLTAALRVLMFRYVWKKREALNGATPDGSNAPAGN